MKKERIVPIVTKEWLTQVLTSPEKPRAYKEALVGRALVALLQRQTNEEKKDCTTHVDNGVGFGGCDAKAGTLSAQSFIKNGGRFAQSWQLDQWLRTNDKGVPRIARYHKQLDQIARERQSMGVTS